jgi:hypothetical protein
MKKLVLLLVLINMGLLTYFNLHYILPSTPQMKHAEINPEKIRVLSQKEIEHLPKKSLDYPTISETSCFEWGIFSARSLAHAQSVLANLSLQAAVKEGSKSATKRFWIYHPPLKTVQEAQIKAAELKALGVEDVVIVKDKKWKNAISFGLFEDEQLAIKLLNELKVKGANNVAKTLLNQEANQSSLMLNNLTGTKLAELKKLKLEFPETILKEVTCD